MKFGTLHQILNPVIQLGDQKLKFLKFKMAAAAILKFVFLAITHRPIVWFQRNFVWGSRTAGRQGLHDKKSKFLKTNMADRRHFEKSLNRHISVKNHCIRYWTRLQSGTKIAIFEIQDGGGCHRENRFFGHYSLTDSPISAKFCMRKQNCMLTNATGQKMQMCKIQDGGRPPFWKSLNCHIPLKILLDFDKIWGSLLQYYYIMHWTWWGFQKRYRRILDVIR